jgi:hypothetical protein
MEKTTSIENQDWFWPVIFKEIESNDFPLSSLGIDSIDLTSSVNINFSFLCKHMFFLISDKKI